MLPLTPFSPFDCRHLNADVRMELAHMKGLKDVEKGVLLEIADIETKAGEDGEYALVPHDDAEEWGLDR